MGGESYFMARALSPGNYAAPTVPRIITPEEINSIDINKYEKECHQIFITRSIWAKLR